MTLCSVHYTSVSYFSARFRGSQVVSDRSEKKITVFTFSYFYAALLFLRNINNNNNNNINITTTNKIMVTIIILLLIILKIAKIITIFIEHT